MCVDSPKFCASPIETPIYQIKKNPICIACGGSLSNEVKEKVKVVKQSYSTVLPNCESSNCSRFTRDTKEKK